MKKFNQKGFTLIELLVVIAIIGLLSSVVLISLNTARSKARDAKRLADLRQVATALELFVTDNGKYPTMATESKVSTALNYGGTGAYTTPAVAFTTYMGKLPDAPTPADTATCQAAAGSLIANDYRYQSADGSTYTLKGCLGSVTGGYSNGTFTVGPNGVSQP